ncbi:MAG: hypothetical protein EOM26_09240 [Alphaproteobacteria bacterium]|nr:hypothetical protein [Alphaproteobacteria bacterium]
MGKLVLILFLGVLGFFGWHWLGPLPPSAAQDYVQSCVSALPGGELACQCAGQHLQDNSRRLGIIGIWSGSPKSQDYTQARVMREVVIDCIDRTNTFQKSCEARSGGRSSEYCTCLQTIMERQLPSAVKRAQDAAETGKGRFADTMRELMAAMTRTAEISCR